MKTAYIKPVMTDEIFNVNCYLQITSGGSAVDAGVKDADIKEFIEFDEGIENIMKW